MINDELSRPVRAMGNLKLYFSDFIKAALKDGREVEAAVYQEMLSVLDNIAKCIDDAMLLNKIRGLPDDLIIEKQGCCVRSGKVALLTTHRSLLRRLLGMKAVVKFTSGYLFLFQKCLLICRKIETRKTSDNKNRAEKYQLEALIYVQDLLEFLDHDYNEDDSSIKILDKVTNIAHIINFDSVDMAELWHDKIMEQAKLYTHLMSDLHAE